MGRRLTSAPFLTSATIVNAINYNLISLCSQTLHHFILQNNLVYIEIVQRLQSSHPVEESSSVTLWH
ncbi:hypothetical protein ACN38_g7354 [Penicillium nordicum]|uniref:Uncharacterized protein n=1 Tax=Penicillium nordicum TaxID=229535 RepID=A0A0N0RYI1_9EURO|nr:hypothetical protein ACN38_g7354 [Penicillium nordicum]